MTICRTWKPEAHTDLVLPSGRDSAEKLELAVTGKVEEKTAF
jgi:hypothetical protein